MVIATRARSLPPRPIARETVQERVYRQFAAMILDGEIEPGQTVTITALAESFGVSAMPVREALQRLNAAGALTILAGRSVGIPPLSVERLMDLRRVRLGVEGMAAEWAAARVTPPMLARLDQLIAVMSHSLPSESGDFMPANREFHFTIYEAAGSATLLALIENLWLRIGPYLSLLRGSGNWRHANEQHKALREALGRRDAAGARSALQQDIEEAADLLSGLLMARA